MQTREKIIEQTFNLLLRKGYDGVSITDIQNTLNISRGLLYHYFGSKKKLFLEVLITKFTAIFRIDLEYINDFTIEMMTNYLLDKYKKMHTEILQEVSIIDYDFLFYRAMQESEELSIIYNNIRNEEQKAWYIALNNSLKRGDIRDDIDLHTLSLQYIYITDGVWMSAVTPNHPIQLITALQAGFETLHTLIRAR